MADQSITSQPIPGEDGRLARMRREITAPEGVALQVRLATVTERALALFIDLATLAGFFLAAALVLVLTPSAVLDRPVVMALLILLSFLVRSFYFAWFEIRWRGATPGKRAMQLRVIDRAGGPLKGEAVMARNLMREVELFLPLTLLLVVGYEQEGRWVILMALLWVGVLALLPVFNRDRLRAGDMLAGTWVIAAPKHRLLPDVAARPAASAKAAPAGQAAEEPAYRFTDQQLAIYGAYELQVLEDVLRRTGPASHDVFQQVAGRIQRKTGWKPPDARPVDARQFLDAFYRAQRSRLERDLTFGKRRASKREPSPRP